MTGYSIDSESMTELRKYLSPEGWKKVLKILDSSIAWGSLSRVFLPHQGEKKIATMPTAIASLTELERQITQLVRGLLANR